tara:strand:- start:1340 stop:1762 length:423 start_codon:yes stop_codon:yes gene_type:complete
MALKEPKSMDECIYFTNRSLKDGKGKARVWVFKSKCPKCGDGLMGKPRDSKTGKPKIRAKEYVCPACNHIVEKKEHEKTLTASIQYTCPHCQFSGETEMQYKRKKVRILNEEKGKKVSVDSLRFVCEKCGENIDITKKMK